MSEDEPRKVFVIEDDRKHLESILFALENIVIGDSLLECDGALIENDRRLVINDEKIEFDDGDELVNRLCECVKEFSPDLIALDQLMPIRGSEVYPKLREVYNGPIVFVTVAPHDEVVKTQREVSRDTFILSKPFTAIQLEKTVQNILLSEGSIRAAKGGETSIENPLGK